MVRSQFTWLFMRSHLEPNEGLSVLGASIGCADMKGQQPLHYSGHPNPGTYQDISAILDLLFVAGADLSSKTGDGETLFNIACRIGRVVTRNALLVFGISPNSSHAIHSPSGGSVS